MEGYYDVLEPRAKSLVDHPDASVRDFAVETIKEIEIFRRSEDSYGYVFYVLQRALTLRVASEAPGSPAALLFADGFRRSTPRARRSRASDQPRVCGLRQAQLAAHDVGALDERNALVVGDPPAQPFATKAAVGGNHQPLGRDIFQRLTDELGDVLRGLDDRVAVIHHPNPNLFVRRAIGEEGEIPPAGASALKRSHRPGAGADRRARLQLGGSQQTLLIGIAPSRCGLQISASTPTSCRLNASVKNARSASVQPGRVVRPWCGGSST